ncbi:MAG: hypothetical protein ACOC7R_04135 [Planctomycetota bacterium]
MKRIAWIAVAVIVALLTSCTTQPSRPSAAGAPGAELAGGTVMHISSGHGNAYTSIGPDR